MALGAAAAAAQKNNKSLCQKKQQIILWMYQRLLRSRTNPHKKKLMHMKYVIILGEHGANVVFEVLLSMTLIIVSKIVVVLNLQ